MLQARARSLSTLAESKTRNVRRQHVRQLSGPIDGDLAATVFFSKLSISPIDHVDMPAVHPSSPLPRPSSHGGLLPPETSPEHHNGSGTDLMDVVNMPDSISCTGHSPPDSSAAFNVAPDSAPSAPEVSTLPSPTSAAHHEQLTNIDISMDISTESPVALIADAVDDISQSAIPLIHLLDQNDIHTPTSHSHENSLATSSPPSGPSSWDDSPCGDVSPRASSPLPASSMPTSPATSAGPSSPCKSHTSPRNSTSSSPAIISPRSMSADDYRASSPVRTPEPATSSPIEPPSRCLAASSPPPSSILGKRAGSEDEHSTEMMGSSSPVKRIRTEDIRSSPPPAATTRRQTATSQQRSRKKLMTPFRSPAMIRKTVPMLNDQSAAELSKPTPPLPNVARPPPANAAKTMTKLALGSRAAAQFKSPMAARSTGGSRSVILPTATIQTLERKVTTLKRAVKIKRDQDEQKLATLAKKWREAGREAAYELWDIVREMTTNGTETAAPGSDSWRSGWGWDGKDEPEAETETDDAMKVDEDGEKPEETLGVMLRKLGIDPETLGWDDALESFVD